MSLDPDDSLVAIVRVPRDENGEQDEAPVRGDGDSVQGSAPAAEIPDSAPAEAVSDDVEDVEE